MNQQAQIGDLLSDLNGFEEQIYRTHLSFDLSRPGAEGATRNMEDLRTDLDAYAEKVKLKLETVDRLCHEGADTLTPEQFAELKEARARLERNYEAVVRTVENLQTRLNAIARLVIEFSSKSSEMHSWITDATRRSGDIRANSADPRMLPEERRRAKALMEDIATKEHELKALNTLFVRLEAEIDQMYAEAPAARDGGGSIQAEDVRKTLVRVESDYADLYRAAADLSVFQNRIDALGGDVEAKSRKAHEWLSRLEASLDENDGTTVEEKLRRAEEMKEKVASERSLLEDQEQASRRLLDALEGTPAHSDVRERQEKALKDQRMSRGLMPPEEQGGPTEEFVEDARVKDHDEHSGVLDRVQSRVNEALAEKAAADGIKKAVGDLAAWSASFEKTVDEATRKGLPLRQASIDSKKSEEQRMRSEMEAHLALAEKMEEEARMAGIAGLDNQVAEARRALKRSNSTLSGWRDNLSDASAGLSDLAAAAATAERTSDQLSAALKQTTPKDAQRLAEIEREAEALAAARAHVAETARKLLGLPDITEEEGVKNTVSSIDGRVAAITADLENKKRAAEELAEVEGEMEENRNEAQALLSSLEQRLLAASPVALSVAALGKQRSEVAEMQRELAAIAPLVEKMEECAEKLWDAAGSSSIRGNNAASGARRAALETSGKLQSIEAAVAARSGRIVDNETGLAAFDGVADDLQRWMGRENEKIRSECGIPDSSEDAASIGRKIERLEKEIRGERRLLDEVARAGSDLRRANSPDAAGADRVAERVRALEDEWTRMGDEMDQAKSRVALADQLHDRAAGLSKWMGNQKRRLEAIGAPSADPKAIKGQKTQLELIRNEMEDEAPAWSKVNEMANGLMKDAPDSANTEKLVQKTDDLNRDWAKLKDDVDRRLARVDAVAEASGSIHGSLRELKKEMAELEAECSRVAKMPSTEEKKRLENLESLLNRTAELDGSLIDLDQSLKEMSLGEEDEAVEWGDVSEAVGAVRNKTDEISKRLEGMKLAALSAKGKEEELDKQLDGLIDLARSTRASLAEGGQPAADAARTAEESRRMDDIVEKLLAKDGEVAMAKVRAAELLSSRPEDGSLKEKSERLAIEWSPLVEEARRRKAAFGQLDDLLKQYDEHHDGLEKKMKEDEEEMAQILAILAADKDNVEALQKLAELEASSDRRKAESEALDKLAERIDAIAPGADARRLKRKSEKLGEDARARAKKTRAAIAGVGKKKELHSRLSQLLEDAAEQAENYGKDVEENGRRMDRARVQSTQQAAAADWKRAQREIAAVAEQLKEISPESAPQIDATIERVREAFEGVNDDLVALDQQLSAAADAADQAKEWAAAVAASALKLAEELADSVEDIGRSPEDLEKNRAECDEQEKAIEQKMEEIDNALADLAAALDNGIITPAQYESARVGLEEARRAMEKAKKRIGQRRKRIDQVEGEIDRMRGDATALRDSLAALSALPVLSADQARGDPTSQANALKEIKEQLRPLSDRVSALVGDCQAMIKSAPPEVNTKALDTLLRDTVGAHDEVAGKVAERERAIDAAAQQMGKYEDAYKALLNWLEETEEMMANQTEPSADAKVARAQRATFDVFLKHLEDKQTSVDGFSALIAKMRDLTSSDDEKVALKAKDDQVKMRYAELLARAQEGQAKLRDAVDLAERYTSLEAPLRAWLTTTEKAINGLGQIPIDGERLERQREEQKRIEDELAEKRDDVKALVETGSMLAALVSVNDATDVTARADAMRRQYEQMNGRCEACGESIENVALHLDQFLAEFAELEGWLTEMEVNMLSLEDLAIDDQDELAEQANLLSELAVDVTEHEGRFSDVIMVGLELCRQTSRDEAMALQHRIDALKMRIADMSGVTDEKLEVMERAIPLAERFHNGFETAMEWIEAVEEDLRMIDEVPLETQLQIVANIEEDLALWRPDIDQVVAMSSQLQAMTSQERASDLHATTSDMNRRASAIGEQVTRRSERLMMAERQSRGVMDELDFVTEWLEEAKERVSAAAPPSIIPEYVKTQLKNQRLLNEDVATQRSRLRDTIAEAKKIARQVGAEGGGIHDQALLAKAEAAKSLADEVAEISEKRAERLEEALALSHQIEGAQDDIVDWLDWMEREIETAPSVMTGTPMAALAAQQKHNMELAAAISVQRALLDRFDKDVNALQSLSHPEDAEHLEEIRGDIVARVEEIKQNVNERGAALDSVMDVSSALGERLDAMQAALAAEAARLRLDEPLTADISALESRVADARNQKEGLRQKEHLMDSLRERIHDVMGTGDASAQELVDKMGQLEKLWSELSRGAELKEQLLTDALGKAKRFWGELDTCERAVDDLKKRLDAIEPCVGQPDVIQAQTMDLDAIAEAVDSVPPLVEELRVSGRELSKIVPGDEKAAISSRIDNVEEGAATITTLCAQKYGDLGRALEEAMAFHGDLGSLAEYLSAAEAAFASLPPLEGLAPEEIAGQLEVVQAIRGDLDNGSMLKEQLQMRVNEIAEGAPAHQVAAIRQPVSELSARWSRLNNGLAEREHAINKSLLEKGQLQETAEQLLLWIEKTQSTVSDLSRDGPTNLGQIEIAVCKLAVIKNDVHSHEPSIMALNRTVRSTEGVAPAISQMVDVINVKWSELLAAIKAIQFGLEKSRSEAELVGDEMDRWAAWTDDVLAALEPRRALPGVPETARDQMDEFLVTKAEMDQTRPEIEAYLRRNAEAGTADQNNWIGRNQAKLESKWNKIKDLASTRQRKLEVAAERADQLDGELTDVRGWLEAAEKSLADAGPISRLPEGLERQRMEQEERMEEIERRKSAFMDTKSLAGQIRASCEAKDAIYVKNQTVTLESRLNKFVQRAGERSKQLDAASQETDTWLDGVNSLEDWMDEIKRKTDATPPTTSDVDRLKSALEEAKDTVADVSSRRPQFEITRKRGISLMEHAPKNERKEIEKTNEQLKKRWEAASAAADARCAEAEKAVLEGGAFTEALANLEDWLDGELAEGTVRREKGCRGDVDTVAELAAAEKKREEARKKKADTIGAITKKAHSLVAEGVEEAPAISAAAGRLDEKWQEMEKEAERRKEELERAMEEARDCDAKVHGLLDWLAEVEGRLKVPPSADLAAGMSAAAAVRSALSSEKPRVEGVEDAISRLIEGCHPDALPALKEWKRVVAARWKEVEDRAAAKEDSMREEEEKQRAREAAMHDLNEFIEGKRLELDEASMAAPPTSVEEAEERVRAHEEFEKELKERQADVDALTKGRRKDGERDRVAEGLADKWRRLWGDSIGHAAQLEKDRALQEELKRLQGWKFDDWRDRYVEWNDHGKARVNDLFRRLDRSSTGSVPREAFIDAIIASKFPTSRLEMAKVADKFDKGDGMINAKEFINALKIGNKKVSTPKTHEEQKLMIKKEMTRRRDQCCCAHKFRIDHEEDAPGKAQPKSDGGVLQTYRFGDQQIRRMVRILHTTVMVRVGGGWEPLDEFLDKHDPCKARDRTNTSIFQQFYDDVRPAHAADKMYEFEKRQRAREDYGSPSTSGSSPHARSTPKEGVTVLKPFAQSGTQGPAKGVREKTEKRSVPMFGENRFARERAESQELLDTSRPSSRAASEVSDAERPTRIPSLRSRKGQRYNPPSARK